MIWTPNHAPLACSRSVNTIISTVPYNLKYFIVSIGHIINVKHELCVTMSIKIHRDMRCLHDRASRVTQTPPVTRVHWPVIFLQLQQLLGHVVALGRRGLVQARHHRVRVGHAGRLADLPADLLLVDLQDPLYTLLCWIHFKVYFSLFLQWFKIQC